MGRAIGLPLRSLRSTVLTALPMSIFCPLADELITGVVPLKDSDALIGGLSVSLAKIRRTVVSFDLSTSSLGATSPPPAMLRHRRAGLRENPVSEFSVPLTLKPASNSSGLMVFDCEPTLTVIGRLVRVPRRLVSLASASARDMPPTSTPDTWVPDGILSE